jgi:hypothetical protein
MGNSKDRKFQKQHLDIKIWLLSFLIRFKNKIIARAQGLEVLLF